VAPAFLAVGAALATALPAAGALRPVERTFGDRTIPRVRAGVLPQPTGPNGGRVRVIATLPLPPLAAAFGRSLAAAGSTRRLDVHAASSRAYLARIASEQQRVATQLRAAIPEARIGRRFQVLLDGLTVNLPARRLPTLVRQRYVRHVYPSLRYTLELNRSPSIIGADVLQRATGADGKGVKIAVVDDGIDQRNPFFAPAGYSYPPGFPKGGRRWTTPKVIVARVFPGPGSGKKGRLALDPSSSFHGTHVAGIAAGDAGTTAPAGPDHPRVTGLSGVAPRAWLGNYRVFTVPTPIGNVANTPEIVAAFEAAVKDGMNVINFSGGGSESEPANDAMLETIHNVVAAGVVPVIAAGNDRDDFGLGSTGSPGTAPDAISVAAVSNEHVFAPALSVTDADAPDALKGIPFEGAAGTFAPPGWGSRDQKLVDVGSIVGRNGSPVERHLCGPAGNLNSTRGQLPPHSLDGVIALAQRGLCAFTTKASQVKAAGAIGLVLSDNREGEANQITTEIAVPGGMIANLDGDRLRAFMASHGGRATVRIGRSTLELQTGRSGIVTSFSSAGPTAFGHLLKPDLSAPGGQVLSSTLPATNPSRFAVFDGTSMATPHVSGAAALLLELHPDWSPQEVKSALVSTAGPAWGDTARTQEAPVPLEGGGLVSLPSATDPQVFTNPASLSFGALDVTHGEASRGLLVRIADAGGGAGDWQVSLRPQSTTAGTSISLPGTLSVAPGGEADLAVVVHAAAGSDSGDDYGFVVLSRGTTTRRVPYLFTVEHPALAAATVVRLRHVQKGTTRVGPDRVRLYRYPAAPFGNAPDTPPMNEDGAERVYVMELDRPAANLGVAVEDESNGAQIDPWILGSLDESDVQGFAATPVDVNELTSDYLVPIGAAGASFPRQQRFYVVVDSGRAPFTNRRLAGTYTLRSWVNDVTPPSVQLLTTRVAAGRPTLVVRTLDRGAGVDPLSLTIGYRGALVGAAAYDPVTGIAVFPLPGSAASLKAGTVRARIMSSDFEEAKNVNTSGSSIMPNTRVVSRPLQVVEGTAVSWLLPQAGACATRSQRLLVAASSTGRVRAVRFLDGDRAIGIDRRATSGLYEVRWRPRSARGQLHRLSAVALDSKGDAVSARRRVRLCR
jgi:subtilisin family serine protease